MMAGEYLMIGGCRDGSTLNLKVPTQTVQVPVPGIQGYDCQEYRREELRVGERSYYVYVYDDVPGADVIGRLIAGYGRDKPEPRV